MKHLSFPCLLLVLLPLFSLQAQEPVKIGLFSIGLDTYWGQFEGLRDRLEGYRTDIENKIRQPGIQVISAGLVDNADKAALAAEKFASEGVELIFLYVSTYALSSTVLPVVQQAGVPVVVLNLQPDWAIDYKAFNEMKDRGKMTGEWLAWCQACSMPEISNVFHRSGMPFHQVTGTLNDPQAFRAINEWAEAARVAHDLRNSRLGILGHYYNGMLDVYSDPTRVTTTFGTYVQHLEISELALHRKQVTEQEVKAKLKEFREKFEVIDECSAPELERAALTACALDRLVRSNRLGALAYYYEGTPGSEEEDIMTSVIAGNSLLTANHVPVAGECEVKNAMAMKIMDLFDAGGSFSEFYLMDFKEDVVLLGHDGPGHIAIAQGKPILKPLGVYHGKPGHGLSVEMKVKNGPVTLLSVVQARDGSYSLLAAEGESVEGPILEIGNTNSRYKFPMGSKAFVEAWNEAGPAHHCAIGTGHIAGKLKKLAAILGMEMTLVAPGGNPGGV